MKGLSAWVSGMWQRPSRCAAIAKRWPISVGLLFVSVLVCSSPAQAISILFDFNSINAGVQSKTASDATDKIEKYMEGVLLTETGVAHQVTVAAGAETRKNRMEAGHPAGLYLGSSDGAPDSHSYPWAPYSHADPKDTFLINRWNSGFDRITITFEDLVFSSVEFDWEIFPVTSGPADFTFKADGTEYYFYDLLAGLTTSAAKKAAREAGDLGHYAGSFLTPKKTFEFIDWTTAPIGMDNFRVNTPSVVSPQVNVPEPSSFLMLAPWLLALGGAVFARSRRR